MPPRPASIKVRALQWLAQREHSRDEMRARLLRMLQRNATGPVASGSAGSTLPDVGDPAAEVDALLDWLEDRGHLSQARFVESRVHARQSRFGNLRIRQELQQHGVVLDADMQSALQRSEYDRALQVWQRKFGAPAADAGGRVRQLRFLAGRGFSVDVVRRVVKAGAAGAADGFGAADSAGDVSGDIPGDAPSRTV